jgi:hypothetical protein
MAQPAAYASLSPPAPRRRPRLAALFRQQVRPRLPALRAAQQRARDQAAIAAALALLTCYPLLRWADWPVAALGAIGVAVLLGEGLARIATAYQATLRATVLPTVCAAVGDVYARVGVAPELARGALTRLGLLSGAEPAQLGLVFRGCHQGTGFVLAELRVPRGGGGSLAQQGFRGLLVQLHLPEARPGRLKLVQRPIGLGRRSVRALEASRGLQPVEPPDQAFHRWFELYADRPAAARMALPPPLRKALTALAGLAAPDPVCAGFDGRHFLLALPTERRPFRLAGPFRPLARLEAELGRMAEEVGLAHALIELLQPAAPARAVEA